MVHLLPHFEISYNGWSELKDKSVTLKNETQFLSFNQRFW